MEAHVEPLLSLADVQTRLGCDRSTLYKLIREGRFPRPRRIGRQWKYMEKDWEAYVLLAEHWFPGPFGERKEKKE